MMRINLGCGYRKIPEHVNIDNRPEVGPDIVCDGLSLPFDDSSVDDVVAFDYLEHIPIGQTVDQITEIWRVLKPGGRLIHRTPSTDGRGAFQDPTHVSFWNINSWLYFMDRAHRDLYGIKANFSGSNRDIWSGDRICHTEGILCAVKEVTQ
jgi:predicted SAM-dependent methyltransferase